MKEISCVIRSKLLDAGFNRTRVSVRCLPSYQIKVSTIKLLKSDIDRVENIVESVYYAEEHNWLIVWVNNYCLPMRKIEKL